MKRLPNFLLMMLTAVLLATFITSCSESSSDSDPSTTPTQPQTPVADGDWQVVPATGGTITKDSLSITFPKGTFPTDTKVAITEIPKGKIAGEHEASRFYQITLPCNASKPMIYKIKSHEKSDDIAFVAYSPGFCKSTLSEATLETILETNYSNGEYSTMLPAFEDSGESQNVYFTIGLGRRVSYKSGNARPTRGLQEIILQEVLYEGKVKNVAYKIIFPYETLCKYDKATLVKLESFAKDINDYIPEALNKLFDLGFKVKGDRILRFYFVQYSKNPDQWGGHNEDWLYYDWSYVALGIDKIFNSKTETQDIRGTVIHEIMHFFQSEYDKRWSIQKGNPFQETNDLTTTNEMAAVWSEHLMDPDLQLNTKEFTKNIGNPIQVNALTLTNIPEAWYPTQQDAAKAYQEQGYIWAPLLYYLCSQNRFAEYKFNNKSIVEYHEIWGRYIFKTQLELLDDWIWDAHQYYLLINNEIDHYYLDLLTKKIIKGFNLSDAYQRKDYLIAPGLKTIDDQWCYPYGCSVYRAYFNAKDIKSLADKEIVIKQKTEGMHTYIIWNPISDPRKEGKYELLYPEAIEAGDSIVISGEKIITMTENENPNLYLITTRASNSTLDRGKKDYVATIELRDKEQEKTASVSPTELTFPAEGGTQTATVSSKGYSRYNHKISDKYKEWLSAKNNPAGKMDITVQPNTTGKERIGYVRVYVFNDENPTEAQKVYLKDSIKVTQAANKEEEQQQESEYELVSGSVNMYYAVLWRWEKSFKLGDDGVTITPNGKGAKVVINQEGTDLTFTWHSTISFEIDDLSLNESNQARISHFRFELEKDVIPYQYYDFHIDSGHELIRMVSPAPKSSYIGGLWTYSKDDLSYYSKSTIHYDKWRKDYYSAYVEHTEESETSEVTDGSSISIGLYINKKK